MAEKQIAIAKETSVQEVSGKIGDKSAGGNRTGGTIFSRVTYILTALAGLKGLFTAERAAKINAIGSPADGEDAATVFGRLKGIKTAAENAVSDPAVLTVAVAGNENTITILDEELYVNNSSTLKVGTFVPEIGGEYKITVNMKNSSLLPGYFYLRASDFDNPKIYSSVQLIKYANYSAIYKSTTASLFLRAGVRYDFYIIGGGLLNDTALYINLITLQYAVANKIILEETTLATDNNPIQLTMASTSGKNTSETQICSYTATKNGSVRLTFTLISAGLAYTQFYIYKNGHRIHYHEAADDPTIFDVDLLNGDEVTVNAETDDSEQYWRISKVTISYDIVPLGINPMYIKSWEEAVE